VLEEMTPPQEVMGNDAPMRSDPAQCSQNLSQVLSQRFDLFGNVGSEKENCFSQLKNQTQQTNQFGFSQMVPKSQLHNVKENAEPSEMSSL
jgi:hypothetical protein